LLHEENSEAVLQLDFGKGRELDRSVLREEDSIQQKGTKTQK
jgi:hypothetical protein